MYVARVGYRLTLFRRKYLLCETMLTRRLRALKLLSALVYDWLRLSTTVYIGFTSEIH